MWLDLPLPGFLGTAGFAHSSPSIRTGIDGTDRALASIAAVFQRCSGGAHKAESDAPELCSVFNDLRFFALRFVVLCFSVLCCLLWPCARVVEGIACKAVYIGSNPVAASKSS